jgi:hypothetical protein
MSTLFTEMSANHLSHVCFWYGPCRTSDFWFTLYFYTLEMKIFPCYNSCLLCNITNRQINITNLLQHPDLNSILRILFVILDILHKVFESVSIVTLHMISLFCFSVYWSNNHAQACMLFWQAFLMAIANRL